jgi:hypothetical protein
MDDKNIIMHSSMARVRRVEITTIENGVQTTRELSGAELEQWKKDHGYDSTENETESDTK